MNLKVWRFQSFANWTHLNPVLRIYRNLFIDLYCKSVDLFLYNRNTGLKRVNHQHKSLQQIQKTMPFSERIVILNGGRGGGYKSFMKK